MSSSELAEWAAFEIINGPIGTSHDDRLTEYLALVVASSSGFRKRKPKAKDYRIEWDRGHRKLSPEEVESKIYQVFGRPKPKADT
jgi:hypothetical protein